MCLWVFSWITGMCFALVHGTMSLLWGNQGSCARSPSRLGGSPQTLRIWPLGKEKASPQGSIQALNFTIIQQIFFCLIPGTFPVFPPTSLHVVSRPGWSKGDLGSQAPRERGWLCFPAQSSAPAPLLPQVIWFFRKEYR